MPGLDSQDGASSGQVVGAHDISSRSEVGADTDTLEDGGGREERLGVCDTEVVHALGHWLSTSSLESAGQESNVSLLILGNDLNPLVNIGGKAGLGKVIRREVLEAISVEFVLKMLESQGVVENVRISDCRHSLTNSEQAGKC